MTIAIVAKASAEETARRLADLPHRAVSAFVSALGSHPERDHGKTAREAARLIHETDRVAARIEGLSPDARDLLLLCSIANERRFKCDVVDRAWSLHGIPAARAQAALGELVALGLLVEAGVEVVPFPNVAGGCGDALMAWISGAGPDSPDALPVQFLLAVLASLVAEEQPRLTQQRRPHARWLMKAQQRMLHPACRPNWTDSLLALGNAVGLWPVNDDADGPRLRPSSDGARAAFGLRPEDWAMAAAGRASGDAEEMAIYGWTLAERAFRRAGSDAADLSDVIAESRALADVDHGVKHGFVPWRADDVMRVAESLRWAALHGQISIDRGRALDKIRRAAPPATDGKWTVLPNYEVLVPADTPPHAVFRLACIARLERVDRVAKFVLDRTTVARRAAIDGLGASAVEILAERSAHPLPEVVAAAVAEWDVGVAPLRGYVGGVIVASSPAQAESLRADVDAPHEIAPGVFFVAETSLKSVLDRARKRGVPVGAVERKGKWDRPSGSSDRVPLPDLVSAASTFRKRFAAVVEAKPKASTPPRGGRSTKKRGSLDAPDADVERLGDLIGVGEDLLRARWPHVSSALADRPELLRRAARLPHDVLRKIGRMVNAASIRASVYRESIEWEACLRASGPAIGENLEQIADEDKSDDGSWIMAAKDFFDEEEDDEGDAAVEQSLPPERPARRRLRLVEEAPTRAVPSPDASWHVHPPGDLRRRLLDAAQAGSTVEILYANAEGRKRERLVRPTGVRTAGGQDWLDALEPAAGNSRVSFLLDRIAAMKG